MTEREMEFYEEPTMVTELMYEKSARVRWSLKSMLRWNNKVTTGNFNMKKTPVAFVSRKIECAGRQTTEE